MVRSALRPALVAATLLLSAPAFSENRIALVIGQSAYRAVTPLPNPVNDARAMAQMLADAGFEVQSASDLTQNELRARIGEFAAAVADKGPDTVSGPFSATEAANSPIRARSSFCVRSEADCTSKPASPSICAIARASLTGLGNGVTAR